MIDKTFNEMYAWPTDEEMEWARNYRGGDVRLKDDAHTILHGGYKCRECGRWNPEGGESCDCYDQRTPDQVLRMAGITYSEIAIASHEQGYTHIIVQTDDNGIITAARTTDTADGYYRNDEWIAIYRYGTGSVPCNCDACAAGDDPADWAGEDVEGIGDEIQRGIDELTKCR